MTKPPVTTAASSAPVNEVIYITAVQGPDRNPEGKLCYCGHAAHGPWEWAPGHLSGFKCICCIRTIWEETLKNVQKGLAELPGGCDA